MDEFFTGWFVRIISCGLETKQNLLIAIYAQSNKALLDILDLRGEGGKPVKILGSDTNKNIWFLF